MCQVNFQEAELTSALLSLGSIHSVNTVDQSVIALGKTPIFLSNYYVLAVQRSACMLATRCLLMCCGNFSLNKHSSGNCE